LASHLADLTPPPEAGVRFLWRGWRITRIGGGRNNRVYRATGEQADVAVKLTSPGPIDRAGREYGALQAIAEAGLARHNGGEIAPRPLLLDRDIPFTGGVVVSTWLDGHVGEDLPISDDEWRCLVGHLLAVHTITPRSCSVPLADQTLYMRSPAEAIGCVQRTYESIPPSDRLPSMLTVMERLDAQVFPSWSPSPIALARGDSNIANMVRRPGHWASVDWEYSGWGDPASEIANLLVHPAYLDATPERLDWLVDLYASLSPDPDIVERIAVYRTILCAFWVARFARMLYQVPRGQDNRLAAWPDDWQTTIQSRYECYLDLANHALG